MPTAGRLAGLGGARYGSSCGPDRAQLLHAPSRARRVQHADREHQGDLPAWSSSTAGSTRRPPVSCSIAR